MVKNYLFKEVLCMSKTHLYIAQSAGVVEYTGYIFAEGVSPPTRQVYWI